jgi:hypothetical protein
MRFSNTVQNAALVLALTAAAGCETVDPFGPLEVNGIQAGTLTVAAATSGLTVTNQTERPVYFVAFEAELATLIDWVPCTGGSGCNPVVQGERRVVAWSSIPGYAPGKTRYLVYWWNTEVGPDGQPRATNIQTVPVSR